MHTGETYRKYQVSGPRYTSYPSANHFSGGFGPSDWIDAARRSNDDPIPSPLSLYLHVPFCTSPCFFCACNRVITRQADAAGNYILRLKREVALQSELFDRDRVVRQLHFGGGTPTTLGCAGLAEVMDALDRGFQLAGDTGREFGMELDPRHTDTDMIDFLADLGFNRVSLGIQDFDPAVQRAVNRVQSATATLRLVDAARERGFRGINVDLICGLPHQTEAGFARTLDRVLQHRPDRIAMYGYAHLPESFKGQRQIDEAALPDLDGKLALLRLADGMLMDSGYACIGMDHYALPDDPLAIAHGDGTLHRNFQGYATHAECDLVGLGVSAIGMAGDVYAQNARDLATYRAALDSGQLAVNRGVALTKDDRIRRTIINELMCTGAVNTQGVAVAFDFDFEAYFADELEHLGRLEADGLIERGLDGFRITEVARPVMRVVAMVFDAYLASAPGRHSRVI